MKLAIKLLNDFAIGAYKEDNEVRLSRGDSGYDLYVCKDQMIEPWSTAKIPLGIAGQPITNSGLNPSGYYLYSRSSISKTPLGLANSVGIIDYGYRGEICAVVRNFSDKQFEIKQGERYFQLCAPDLTPIEITIVQELDSSLRGTGGFGSTGL